MASPMTTKPSGRWRIRSQCGSIDVEDRNAVARHTLAQSDLVLVVGQAGVAGDLIVAQQAVDDVAADLRLSHERADAVAPGNPGEASDAASCSPENGS